MVSIVIDAFKMIEIEHDDTESDLTLPTGSNQALVFDIEGSHIAQTCQFIRKTESFELVVSTAQSVGRDLEAKNRIDSSDNLPLTRAAIDKVVTTVVEDTCQGFIVVLRSLAEKHYTRVPITLVTPDSMTEFETEIADLIKIDNNYIGVMLMEHLKGRLRARPTYHCIYRVKAIWVKIMLGVCENRTQATRGSPRVY